MILKELITNPSYPKKAIIEKLLMHRLNISKEMLFTHDTYPLTDEDVSWIDTSYTAITQDHKPIEHVIGYCEFLGYRFTVNGDTLIPRPETEYMIESVNEWIGIEVANGEQLMANSHKNSITLLDIGTGCGVLGLSTLLHRGEHISQAVFTDLSGQALTVAKGNYARFLNAGLLKNAPPVEWIECSLMDHEAIRKVFNTSPLAPLGERGESNNHPCICLEQRKLESDILIVANLPYIPNGLFEDNTDPSVHNREPKMAFVGGDDGMDLYRIMLKQIVEYTANSEQLMANGEELIAKGEELVASRTTITMFLEMMTWQVELLRKEFGKRFEFEEVKTFHFNIRIVKGVMR